MADEADNMERRSVTGLEKIEVTPEMVEAGLEIFRMFDPYYSDGRREVRGIMELALANLKLAPL